MRKSISRCEGADSAEMTLMWLSRKVLKPHGRLPRRIHTVEQAIAATARRTMRGESARRGFHRNITHQAKVAVGRTIEFKHKLAAARTVLPAPDHARLLHHKPSSPISQPAKARRGERYGRRSLLRNVPFRGGVKLGLATLGAEINGLSLILARGGSLLRVNGHLANRINNFHKSSPPKIL